MVEVVKVDGRVSRQQVTNVVTAISPLVFWLLGQIGVDVPPDLVIGFLVSAGSLSAFFFRAAKEKQPPRAYDGR